MNVFVGQEACGHLSGRVVDKAVFVDAAVVGLVMLESEVRDVIAERVEEVIVAVVMRAEKFLRLFNEVFVVIPDFLGRIERSGAIG
ncbi:MAG TPA: hypothetical protein VGR40_06475, partial [Candidatus Binatus sp.]|nr:hypothetical protein [Candidatus Binatus sp.]